MHPNLCRLLTSWDSDPVKTKEALVLLTHLLLQQTPSRARQRTHHREDPNCPFDALSDALANFDLLLHWMVEACFACDNINVEVIALGEDAVF